MSLLRSRFPLRACALALLCASACVTVDRAARANDVGAVIESIQLSRFGLNAPETRVAASDGRDVAWVVGRMQNRLFLYRYDKTVQPARRVLRSDAMAMPDDLLRAAREAAVAINVRAFDAQQWVWVGVSLTGSSTETPARGFLVDGDGRVASVVADTRLATIVGPIAWDARRQEAARAVLKQTVLRPSGSLETFPAALAFEQTTPPNREAELRRLHGVARSAWRGDARTFADALSGLTAFFQQHDFRDIDPANGDPATVAMLNDYAFWLTQRGDPIVAEPVMSDVLRRAPDRVPAYLNRADARMAVAQHNYENERTYYQALAREDYREYCSRRLKDGAEIPSNVAGRIQTALATTTLDATTCRPQYVVFSAIAAADVAGVNAQLALGQDANVRNARGVSALSAAVSSDNLEIVRALLAAGARPDERDLGTAISRSARAAGATDAGRAAPDADRFAIADALREGGAAVDSRNADGATLLMQRIAYYADDRPAVQYLLDHGADPQARDKRGQSVLHIAMARQKARWVAEALLARGVDASPTYGSMSYGYQVMHKTPLLDLLRTSTSPIRPGVAPEVPDGIAFLIAHGADTAVGGYGLRDSGVPRNGLREALALAGAYLSPALIDRLVQAARKPSGELDATPLTRLLMQWSRAEYAAAQDLPAKAAWDVTRAAYRETAESLLAAGVPVNLAATPDGVLPRDTISLLAAPWVPDDLYRQWLAAGADQGLRTDEWTRIYGIEQPQVLPVITMQLAGEHAKVDMLLADDRALFSNATRCGMTVADALAVQVANDGMVSPDMGRVVSQLMAGAARAPACDYTQTSQIRNGAGMRAIDMAARLGVTLPAP
ncbi:ankyrin repeat domain-containing protein [Alcaligenaceae bacterium C4P045]|nr:ankyrin repeat domain-containing protein [Alcaligenaceae bacterium C4P045]